MLLIATAFMATTLSGCNTARGFGQDIQKLGSTISHSAS
ncbi:MULTISPECIES: entericidin A/B family lipoprotein [Dickeya]